MTTDRQRDEDARLGLAVLGLIPPRASDAAVIHHEAAAPPLAGPAPDFQRDPPLSWKIDAQTSPPVSGDSRHAAAGVPIAKAPPTGRAARRSRAAPALHL